MKGSARGAVGSHADISPCQLEQLGNVDVDLAFFKRLLIDDDCTVTSELAEPFDMLLGEDLRRAVIAQESEELTEAIEEAQRRGPSKAKTTTTSSAHGSPNSSSWAPPNPRHLHFVEVLVR